MEMCCNSCQHAFEIVNEEERIMALICKIKHIPVKSMDLCDEFTEMPDQLTIPQQKMYNINVQRKQRGC